MKEFKAELIRSFIRAEKAASYQFRPETAVDYCPGQFVQVIFDEADSGNRTLNKYLSFSCRPGKDYFEVTKKLTGSDFSLRLAALRAGDQVLFKGPLGNCGLNDKEQKIGFLTGGIGITPVIAMIEHVADKKSATDICLLYSNWTGRDIAFKPELDAWSAQNKNIRVVYTLVECQPEDAGCFEGMITAEFVQKHMPDYKERRLFIFGPPVMVKAMQDICRQLGSDPARIKVENFIGY
jgi:glycine betaine catabolism B